MWKCMRITTGIAMLLVFASLPQVPGVLTTYAQDETTCSLTDPNLINPVSESFDDDNGIVALLYNWDLEQEGDNGVLHLHDLERGSQNALPELGGDVKVMEVSARILSGVFQFHFGTERDFSGFFVAFGTDFGELYQSDQDGFRRIGSFRYTSKGWQQYRVIFTVQRRIQVCIDQHLVLDVTVKDGPQGNFIALGGGNTTDVYLDNLNTWSTDGEVGSSLCFTAAQRKLTSLGGIRLVDQNREPDINSTDNIQLDLSNLGVGETADEIRWYRNGALLLGAQGGELSNRRMKTFDGNSEECSPASPHTSHTIAGYVFTAEVYDKGFVIGRASTTIQSPFYSGKIRSIILHTWDHRLDQASTIEHAMDAMVSRTNANWVKITRLFFQQGILGSSGSIVSATDPSDGLKTLSDSLVIHAFNIAHKLGLKVYYGPLLLELGDGFRYTHRQNSVNSDFLQHYHDFIVNQAELAQKAGIELFAIGEELPSLLSKSQFWHQVITDVRKVYDGKLTYQVLACCEGKIANLFDKTWLKDLDYIGLGINFDRRNESVDPTVDSLVMTYQKRISVAKKLSEHFNKLVLFTEFSLLSSDGGSVDSSRRQQTIIPDWQEQADATEAILETIQDQTDWSVGIAFHIWPAFTDSPYAIGDCCYPNLYLKSAEKVISSWFNPENKTYQMPTKVKSISDADGDGIPDEQDYCPNYAGEPEANGC